jgi:hypothetical protein
MLQDSLAWDVLLNVKDRYEVKIWEKAGMPVPPPHGIKQRILREYASSFMLHTLIETGTLFGDMVYAMKRDFDRIISIELDAQLYKRAHERFANLPHVEIIHGDSGDVLSEILSTMSESCLFWLDGHYSGGGTARGTVETPIIRELKTILQHKIGGHVILVDDARCFDGTHDYPKINELSELVSMICGEYELSVQHDIIRIHPKVTST